METRDEIFRDRLVAVMTMINGPDGKRLGFRNRIGALATRLAKEAGARNWADLKARADGPTYDSMLRLFQRENESAHKHGDARVADALEVLAISLIARRQTQADLVPGVELLDRFVEDSEKAARHAKAAVLPAARRIN